MKSNVMVKLTKEEIQINIDDNCTKEQMMQDLKNKIIDLKSFYKNEKTPVRVTGRVLKNDEIKEIQEIINKVLQVKVTFDSPRELGLSGIKKVFNREIETSETKYYKGALRSGQKIEFEGSVVIIGDVNDGAEVIASDHIVILGKLRGLAHAGAKGNKKAIIAAQKICSMQVRIANIVKEIDKDNEQLKNKKYVYIEDDNIVIE